jgi:hypothetical protein
MDGQGAEELGPEDESAQKDEGNHFSRKSRGIPKTSKKELDQSSELFGKGFASI